MRIEHFDLIDWVTDAQQLDLDDEQIAAWVRKGFQLSHPHIWNQMKTKVQWAGGERFVAVYVEASRRHEAIKIIQDIEHIYSKFHKDTSFVVK